MADGIGNMTRGWRLRARQKQPGNPDQLGITDGITLARDQGPKEPGIASAIVGLDANRHQAGRTCIWECGGVNAKEPEHVADERMQ